jgi:hypothetical protein
MITNDSTRMARKLDRFAPSRAGHNVTSDMAKAMDPFRFVLIAVAGCWTPRFLPTIWS